jgi:hypothetical protein
MKPFKKLDDEIHFWVGMIISFLTFFVLDNTYLIFEKLIGIQISKAVIILLTFLVPVLAAIGKETYDKKIKKTKFDWRDSKFTIIGGALFPLLLTIIEIVYFYSKP